MKHIVTLWLLFSSSIIAAPEALLYSLQRLQSVQNINSPISDAEYLRASSQVLQLWDAATPEDKTIIAHRMALIHYERARRFAGSGHFKDAASELRAEATIQKEFGGRIEYATKSPDSFFRDLVELQAQVTAETGSDPLAGMVDYFFEKAGDSFTAARLALGDDIAGITVQGIGKDEALALVHRLNRQSGRVETISTKWLIVSKGRLSEVLNQATREVVFNADGRMVVKYLNSHADKAASTDAANLQVSSPIRPPSPMKESEAMPGMSTQSEELASSTPWPVLVVLVVAATGLMWLLLKKRK